MTARTDGPSAGARIRVMKRDRFRCTYCGQPGTDVELEIDHIVPVAKGGSHHISNLTTACRQCNQAKGTRTMTPTPSAIVQPQTGKLGLIGMCVHTLEQDPEMTRDPCVERQGCIVGEDGDFALVQLFSWLTGGPNKIVAMKKVDLYDPSKSILYSDHEHMRVAYERMELGKSRR